MIKKMMLDFNYQNEKQYYSERYNSNNIIYDINNIEKFKKMMIFYNRIKLKIIQLIINII